MKRLAGLVLVAAVLAGCASTPQNESAQRRSAALEALEPVKTIPEKRPAWVDSVPVSDRELAFVGVSNQFATDAEARGNAQANGRTQLVAYYGTSVLDKGQSAKATLGLTSDVFDPEIAAQEVQQYMAEGVAKQLPASEFYTEIYVTESNKYAYRVYALMKISKADAEKAMNDYYARKASEYREQAAKEEDAEKRQQLEKTADFFGSASLF